MVSTSQRTITCSCGHYIHAAVQEHTFPCKCLHIHNGSLYYSFKRNKSSSWGYSDCRHMQAHTGFRRGNGMVMLPSGSLNKQSQNNTTSEVSEFLAKFHWEDKRYNKDTTTIYRVQTLDVLLYGFFKLISNFSDRTGTQGSELYTWKTTG